MSTKKITALTELAAAAAATDMIPVVDVSDTTDAATGTTKKITALNIGKGIGIGAGNTTSEPVKINTSTGVVGMGVSSPTYQLHVANSSFTCSMERFAGASTAGPGIDFNKSRGSSVGAFTVVSDGDVLGSLLFKGADGNSWAPSAMIRALVDGTPGDGDMPGRLEFATTPDGQEAVTERMRIDSKGNMGLGTSAPGTWLASGGASGKYFDISVSSQASVLSLVSQRDTDNEGVGIVSFVNDSNADAANNDANGKIIAEILSRIATSDSNDGDDSGGVLEFRTKPEAGTITSRMRIDSTGNLLLGGTATPTSSVGNLCLFNGTAPAASVTNGVVLYAQDVSTSELKVRDEAGNVSTLSPHNFDLLGDRSEDMAWSYSSKNVFVGKEIAVDMTKVIRALEKLTGEEYIKIRDIADSEKLDWATEEKRKEAEQKKRIDAYKVRKSENAAHPTNSSTKADIKAFLDKNDIEYDDAAKDKLFEKVPDKPEFIEVEPASYSKKSKPSWIS